MAGSTIRDLTEATNVDRRTAVIEVETDTPASRKMTIRNALGTGHALYADSVYTTSNRLTINNALTKVTIDGLGSTTEKGALPLDSNGDPVEFWDTVANEITPESIYDAFIGRIDLVAEPQNADAFFDLYIDIGSGSPIYIFKDIELFPKGTGQEQAFSLPIPIFALTTFLSNGGSIYIDTTGGSDNIEFWDFRIFLCRVYAGA